MRAVYRGDATDAQVQWGGNDDPRGVLIPGEAYRIDGIEVHSWHTKYIIEGHAYNSVHFDPVEQP